MEKSSSFSSLSSPRSAEEQREIAHEIWGLVISQPLLSGKDLKNIRLVASTFKDFATPRLFRQISFSLIRENVASTRNIGRDPSLAALVKTIDLDDTHFLPATTTRNYCEVAALCFQAFVGPQTDGPLCEANLRAVMSASPSTKFSDKHLPKPLRLAFQTGFRLLHARQEYCLNFGKGRNGLVAKLKELVEPFENLKSIRTYHEWHRIASRPDQTYGQMFKAYLKKHLEPTTFELINGLTAEDKQIDITMVPATLTLFKGPGVAARTFDPLWLPPIYPPRGTSFGSGFPIYPLISALKETKIKVRSFHCPIDADNAPLRHEAGAFDNMHYIHPAALVGNADPRRVGNNAFLVALFSSLKYLDLKIDPCFHNGIFPTSAYNSQSITVGIQALSEIEELHLAFRRSFPDDTQLDPNIGSEAWSIRRAFLFGLVPHQKVEDNESDDDSDNDDENYDGDGVGGPPANMLQTLLNNINQPGPANATTGPTNAPIPLHIYPLSLTLPPHNPRPLPRPNFYDRLPVNPWPRLRTLSLIGLNTSLPDACVLFKTIAGTLRNLTLRDLRLSGSCKACHSRGLHRAEHGGSDFCFEYLDLIVAIKGIVSLDRCVVSLWEPDFIMVLGKLGWQMTDENHSIVNERVALFEGEKIKHVQGCDFVAVKEGVDRILGEWLMSDEDAEMWQLVRRLEAAGQA